MLQDDKANEPSRDPLRPAEVPAVIEAEVTQELLLTEFRHRVRNNMQMIMAFIAYEAKEAGNAEVRIALAKVAQRVRGLSVTQDALMHRAPDDLIDLSEFLRSIAVAIIDLHAHRLSLVLDSKPLLAPVQIATPIGVIVNELLTNCCKYAYPDQQSGRIHLSVHELTDGSFEVLVRDEGPGFSSETLHGSRERLGLGLIRRLAQRAHLALECYNDGGAVARLSFKPVPHSSR